MRDIFPLKAVIAGAFEDESSGDVVASKLSRQGAVELKISFKSVGELLMKRKKAISKNEKGKAVVLRGFILF